MFFSDTKKYSPFQFALWRSLFGAYLAYYFLATLPYAAELYSSEGIFSNSTLNWTYGYFPNILDHFDSSFFVEGMIAILAALSLFLTVGWGRQASALLLWYGMACLMNRNILTVDPSLAFIGWLLIALVLIPAGEPLSLSRKGRKWYMPAYIYWGAWLTLGLAYTASGVDKFMAPSWQNGLAMKYILELPIAYEWWFRDFLLALPEWLLRLQTWVAGGVFLTALPAVFFSRMRLVAWILLTAMFGFTLIMLDLVQVVLGVFLFHFFLFDSTWFTRKDGKRRLVLYDDSCGVCSRFISFVAREDLQNRYQFAGFGTQTAVKILSEEERKRMEEMVFMEGERVYRGADAGIRILESLGGMWRMASLARLLPPRMLEGGYRFLARNRHRLGLQVCVIPNDERFLP